MKRVELLAPAGDFEKLQIACHYGADAVYAGGPQFNLRAFADNFSNEELREAISWVHARGKKIFVTLNIIAHNQDLDAIPAYVRFLEHAGIDGVIVSDLGVFEIVREESSLPIHISTQASATNWRSVKAWKQMGAKRVILARELSLVDIRRIRDAVPDVELEVFAHGAMCMSISGRCVLSAWLTGRDANRGTCTHPCRWKYQLVEEKRPGQYFPVLEDERGSYILNSRDLCALPFMDELVATGIDSIKIEGRIKGIYYAAVTTNIYRKALDSTNNGTWQFEPNEVEELQMVTHRGFTSGFFKGNPDFSAQNYEATENDRTTTLVAKVLEVSAEGTALLQIRNRVSAEEKIEVITPGLPIHHFSMPIMTRVDSELPTQVTTAHPNSLVKISTDGVTLKPWDLLRTRTSCAVETVARPKPKLL